MHQCQRFTRVIDPNRVGEIVLILDGVETLTFDIPDHTVGGADGEHLTVYAMNDHGDTIDTLASYGRPPTDGMHCVT